MKLFGLSNLEILLSIVLTELTWSGFLFFRGFFTPTLQWSFHDPILFVIIWLIYGMTLFLRFMAPFILLIAVLKNQLNEHCQLIKIWFYVTILMDTLFLVFGILAHLLKHYIFQLSHFGIAVLIIQVGIFILLRLFILFSSQGFVSDLSVKEGNLFPSPGSFGVFKYLAGNLDSLVKVILSWEIVWSLIRIAHLIHLGNYSSSFFVPLTYYYFDIFTLLDTIVPITLYSLQLLSLQKKWKIFFTLLIAPYLCLSILWYGYALGYNNMSLLNRSGHGIVENFLETLVLWFFAIFELILKFFGFIGMCGLICGSKSARYWDLEVYNELGKDGEKEAATMDPLLSKETLPESN